MYGDKQGNNHGGKEGDGEAMVEEEQEEEEDGMTDAVFRTSLEMDMMGEQEAIDFGQCHNEDDENNENNMNMLEWEVSTRSRSKGSCSGDAFDEGENKNQTNGHRNGQGLGSGLGQGLGQGQEQGLSKDALFLGSNSSDSALGLHPHRVTTTSLHDQIHNHDPTRTSPSMSDSPSSSPFFFGDDLLQNKDIPISHPDHSAATDAHEHEHKRKPEREHEHEDASDDASEGSTIDFNDQQDDDDSSLDSTDPTSPVASPKKTPLRPGSSTGTGSNSRSGSGSGGRSGSGSGALSGRSSGSGSRSGGPNKDNKDSHSRTPRQHTTSSMKKQSKLNPDLLLLAPPAIIASTLALYPHSATTPALATPIPLFHGMQRGVSGNGNGSCKDGRVGGSGSGSGGSVAGRKCQSDDCRICSLFRPRDLLGDPSRFNHTYPTDPPYGLLFIPNDRRTFCPSHSAL